MNGGHLLGDGRARKKWRGLQLLAATAVLTLCLAVLAAHPVGAGATASEPTTGVVRICNGCDQHIGDAARYSYIILQPTEYRLIPKLKDANPGIKVLEYKDTEATVSYGCHAGVDDRLLPAGVGYCWAEKDHPGWFVTDTREKQIEFADYPHLWLMDVGNRLYQEQWAKNVAAEAKALGFDGVELDDVNDGGQMHWHLGSRTMAKYKSIADWNNATTSFMAYVGPALKARGLLVLPNVAISDYWTDKGFARWNTWTTYASGGIQEYYTKWSRGSEKWLTGTDWETRQRFLRTTDAAGRIFLGVTYAPIRDARSQRYARASFLLDWQGGPSALIYQPSYPLSQDAWTRTWTANVGSPIGSRYQVGVAWRRDYTDGTVIVNPSSSTKQRVSLGKTYVDSNGAKVTRVTVPAADARILKRVGEATARPRVDVVHGGKELIGRLPAWARTAKSSRYQWLRCRSKGGSCIPIELATGPTYSVRWRDIGARIRFKVVTEDPKGSHLSESSPSVVALMGGHPHALALTSGRPVGRVAAHGAIRTRHALQWFSIRFHGRAIRVRYADRRSGVVLRSVRIRHFVAYRHELILRGQGRIHARGRGTRRVGFAIALRHFAHVRTDVLVVRLGTGYHRRAHLVRGEVAVR